MERANNPESTPDPIKQAVMDDLYGTHREASVLWFMGEAPAEDHVEMVRTEIA